MSESWNHRYLANDTPWDIGYASPAIVSFFEKQHISRSSRILIPGCGFGHEAEALLQHGYSDITLIEMAEIPIHHLEQEFGGNLNVRIIKDNFFEHRSGYDFIIEQTFFCALPPAMRTTYASHMQHSLKPDGLLVGLLFDRTFEGGPPYGGSDAEYRTLFAEYLLIEKMEVCRNSVGPRQGSELWVEMSRL